MTDFNDKTKQIKDFSNQNLKYKRLFFSTALAGEVGEYCNLICNLIKKFERGDYHKDITDYLKYLNAITSELADIFIYLVLNARTHQIDLEIAIKNKIHILKKQLEGDTAD